MTHRNSLLLARGILLLLALGCGAACQPRPSQAADRKLDVSGFYVYPDAKTQSSGQSSFAWPDDKNLSAMVQVKLAGFSGEQKLELFLVLFDEDGKVLKKQKGKHSLPAGSHDLVFNDFWRTGNQFDEAALRLELEATLKGAAPVKRSLEFSVAGPDAPDVQLVELSLFNPQWGRGSAVFNPGSPFTFEAVVEIEDNVADVTPRLVIYGVMEEDSRDIDPSYEYQPYTNHWDSLALPAKNGVFRITATGHLPYFFQNAWDSNHAFRIYAVVDFGGGARQDDYARAELSDPDPGDKRVSEDLEARLIELDRNWAWQLKRLRAGTPETRDTWR